MQSDEEQEPIENNPIESLFYDFRHGLWFSPYKYINKTSSSQKVVKQYIEKQNVAQIYARPPRHMPQYPIIGDIDSWQLDLMFVPVHWITGVTEVPNNKDMKLISILTAIHTISRYAYAYSMENKSSNSVCEALTKFIDAAKPNIITTDNGTEWLNKDTQELFVKNKIKHFVNNVGDHYTMGIIERFHRTLKQLLRRAIEVTDRNQMCRAGMGTGEGLNYDNNNKWFPFVLASLIYNYNHSIHRTIHTTPSDMHGVRESQLIFLTGLLEQKGIADKDVTKLYQVGDHVRVYVPAKSENLIQHKDNNWSRTIYRIESREGNKFTVINRESEGIFEKAAWELKKIEASEGPIRELIEIVRSEWKHKTWQAERILNHMYTRMTVKYLIKWQRYDDSFNTWEDYLNLRYRIVNEISSLEKQYIDSLADDKEKEKLLKQLHIAT